MGDKTPRQRLRNKEAPTAVEAGKGVPVLVSQALKNRNIDGSAIVGAPAQYAPRRSITLERLIHARHSEHGRQSLGVVHSGISEISRLLELDEFEFPDEDELLLETELENPDLDVTALDRYNEDIRKLRRMCVDECRSFPQAGEPDAGTSSKIQGIIRALCRTTFYGTNRAQVLAERTVILIMWLLNKKNVATKFKIHILQSFSEMAWSSDGLKTALYRCNGMRVLAKLLAKGVTQRSDQARWACYTLAMACIGCREIIEFIQEIPQVEEIVGEIAFHAYWNNWPANFGQILQGILFGPHSVIPVEDDYQFL